MKQLIQLIFLFSVSQTFGQIQQLAVESNHSRISFTIDIAGFSKMIGTFTDYSIDIDWDQKDFTKSTVRSEIQISSINTGIPERDGHLQSEDFFNSSQHPTAIFTSDSIVEHSPNLYIVYGKFQLNGMSKSISVPFELRKVEGNTLGISAKTTINRKDFSVAEDFEHTNTPNFLSDSVEIEIDFWTKRRK